MNFWIFTANNAHCTAKEAYQLRMTHRLWGIGSKTPNQRNLVTGDKVVFYLTNPAMAFAGTATISSTVLNEEEQDMLSRESVFLNADGGVRLADIDEWEEYRPIKALLSDLKFIKNKENWGSHLQGGVTRISEEDYELITRKEMTLK